MNTPRTQPSSEAELVDAIGRSRHLVFLTGAGISAAAGIRTFRGPAGLYGNGEITAPVHVDDMVTRPDEVAVWHNDRQADIAEAEPTAAHRAISRAAVGTDR